MVKTDEITLLITDDDPQVREVLESLLEDLGCKILIANDGAQGLEVLRKNKVDLVISDIRMPNINGIEFFLKAKSELGESIPFIFITADPGYTMEEAKKLGVIQMFNKPLELTAFHEKIKENIFFIRNGHNEKRQFFRMSCKLDGQLKWKDESFAAEITNISKVGVCFRVKESLALNVNDGCEIAISFPEKEDPILFAGSISWVENMKSYLSIGIEFTQTDWAQREVIETYINNRIKTIYYEE